MANNEVKLFDGFSEQKPPGRYMDPPEAYNNPKPELGSIYLPDVVSHYSLPDNVSRTPGTENMDTNFIYHSVDQHTLVNVLRTELDIIEEQGWYDRDEEIIRTWLNRRIGQLDNEIKIEKRVKGGNNKTDTT